jgi:hypothetical protein
MSVTGGTAAGGLGLRVAIAVARGVASTAVRSVAAKLLPF